VNRRFVVLTLGLLVSLSLEVFAWKSHFRYYGILTLAVILVLPISSQLWMWWRSLHPNHPPSRWTEESVSYKRYKDLRSLRWVVSGILVFVPLGIILSPLIRFFLGLRPVSWKITSSHLWVVFLFIVYEYILVGYAIWRQYYEQRKPLVPFPPKNLERNIYTLLDRGEEWLWKPRRTRFELYGNSEAVISLQISDKIKHLDPTVSTNQPKSDAGEI
jgi:hypothetical protein